MIKNVSNQYQKEGFLVIKNFLEQNLMKQLLLVTEKLETDKFIQEQYKSLYDFENYSSDDQKKHIRRIQCPEQIDSLYYKIASSEQMINLLKIILGENIRLEGIKINFKAPFGGAAIEWHQDWAFQQYTNDDVLTVSILLDENTVKNAPMRIMPGTHTGPVYEHAEGKNFNGVIDIEKNNINISKAVMITGNAGDVCVHHYRCVHGSGINTSTKPRRILFFRYASADAWPLWGTMDFRNGFNLEELQCRIVNGEQTLWPRLEKVPVRMPLPYPEDWSNLYRVQENSMKRYF